MANLGVRVGLGGMVDAAGKFGFNDTGLRIPSGVAKSNFDTDMTKDQLALSSIGQFNTSATPLQMAMVSAAVANGGELMYPHLVDETRAEAGGSSAVRNRSRTAGRWTPQRRSSSSR